MCVCAYGCLMSGGTRENPCGKGNIRTAQVAACPFGHGGANGSGRALGSRLRPGERLRPAVEFKVGQPPGRAKGSDLPRPCADRHQKTSGSAGGLGRRRGGRVPIGINDHAGGSAGGVGRSRAGAMPRWFCCTCCCGWCCSTIQSHSWISLSVGDGTSSSWFNSWCCNS